MLALDPDGTTASLIRTALSSDKKVNASLRETAKGSDVGIKAGSTQLQEAIKPLKEWVADFSPSGTVRELEQLRVSFDGVLSRFPDLEPLLQIGQQSLAEVTGAYDVVLQQRSRPSDLVDLIKPAVALGREVELYSTLAALFDDTEAKQPSETVAVIEIDGADDLLIFAAYVSWLSFLSETARGVVDHLEQNETVSNDVTIARIESGSPIRIQLKGGARVLNFMLAMVRDLVRVPYQYLTTHGRLIQSMETFAVAKELGIDSQEVLDELERAVLQASRGYNKTIRRESVAIVVEGERVTESPTHALPPPEPEEPDVPESVRRLSGPTS